jgi:hypothetical protein
MTDDTSRFASDLMNGAPVTAPYLAAMASGDPQQILAVPAQFGYNLTTDGVSKLVAAADPGPNFDIKMGEFSGFVFSLNRGIEN